MVVRVSHGLASEQAGLLSGWLGSQAGYQIFGHAFTKPMLHYAFACHSHGETLTTI